MCIIELPKRKLKRGLCPKKTNYNAWCKFQSISSRLRKWQLSVHDLMLRKGWSWSKMDWSSSESMGYKKLLIFSSYNMLNPKPYNKGFAAECQYFKELVLDNCHHRAHICSRHPEQNRFQNFHKMPEVHLSFHSL